MSTKKLPSLTALAWLSFNKSRLEKVFRGTEQALVSEEKRSSSDVGSK
jgi:hypothetical protein